MPGGLAVYLMSRLALMARADGYRRALAQSARSEVELAPIRAALAAVEAELGTRAPVDPQAVLEAMRARAKALGVC